MTFRHLHDTHKGETCIVIGNGPSLARVPREFLSKYPSFGCNYINKLPFIPDYYTVVDILNISEDGQEFEAIPAPVKFVRANTALSGYPLNCIPRREFSYQPNEWVWEGFSVTYVMLQLAYYLGFTTALLVGVDFHYQLVGNPNPKVPRKIKGPDPNHFCPDYHTGKTVTYPKMDLSRFAFGLAKQAYEAHGRRVLNLTEGTHLDVFDKGALEMWL